MWSSRLVLTSSTYAGVRNGESYCHTFDLSSTIPEEVIDDALKTDRLHLINATGRREFIEEMTEYLSSDTSAPVRVCIPMMGSPIWGGLTAEVGLRRYFAG
jgi:elongator complex protein 4